jgi:hypothetical protein
MAGLGPPLAAPETPSIGSTLDLAIPGGTSRSTCSPRARHHAPCLLRARLAPASVGPNLRQGAATSSSTPRGAIRGGTPLTDLCDRSRMCNVYPLGRSTPDRRSVGRNRRCNGPDGASPSSAIGWPAP